MDAEARGLLPLGLRLRARGHDVRDRCRVVAVRDAPRGDLAREPGLARESHQPHPGARELASARFRGEVRSREDQGGVVRRALQPTYDAAVAVALCTDDED